MFWRKNPEYWGSAGAGVIPVTRSTGRFLVPLRSQYVNEPGTWGTIGGAVDDEEDFDEAALREYFEETCGPEAPDLIDLLTFEDEEAGFVYQNFLGVIEEEFEPCINWETARWAWLDLNQLLELSPMHYGLEAVLDDPESLETLEEYAHAP